MQHLKDLFLSYVGQTSESPYGLIVDRAEGVYIYDDQGKRYFDLIAGIGPAAVGHSHPEVVQAGIEQMKKYMHTMVYGEHIQKPQVSLAEYLVSLLPAPFSSCYFVNSGAEAVEAALKVAKKASGRYEIVACRKGYHGSTHATASLSSDQTYTQAFRPFVPGVRFIEWNDTSSLSAITSNTAAVILETMQGEAGCRVPDASFIQAIRSRCDELGTILILDEIQVGLGRTGLPFAFMHYDIQPDIIVLAKALGGGLPLGAIVSSADLIKEFSYKPILGHCTTFGGHPVSCATGLAAVKKIMEGRLYENAQKAGLIFREALNDHPLVKNISGEGLWMAVDVGDFCTVQELMWRAKEKGLITDWFLYNNHSFRICPPLTITEKEVRQAISILQEVLDSLAP